MQNELFIKVETAFNFFESFTHGLSDWTITNASTPVDCGYGIVWLNNGEFTQTISTELLVDSYRVSYTLTTNKDGSIPTGGYIDFYIGGQMFSSETVSGSYTKDLILDGTADLTIDCMGWTGGLADVRISSLTGEYKQIDLYDDIEIPLTFNIADISDFTKRNASFSKTINIPGTVLNNALFKHLYNIQTSGSFILNHSVFCYIVQDTIKVFEGSFELQKCITDKNREVSYEGLVYSTNASLYTKMGSKLLKGNPNPVDDISFKEYTEILTAPNIEQHINNPTYGEGLLYVPINKQNRKTLSGSASLQFSTEEMSPAVYIKEIWYKIFEQAGFTYTSTFFNSDYFKRLIYPHTDKNLYISEDIVKRRYWKGLIGPTTNSIVYKVRADAVYSYCDWTVAEEDVNLWDNATSCITITEDGFYDIDLSYTYGLKMSASDAPAELITDGHWDIVNMNLGHPPTILVINQLRLIRSGQDVIFQDITPDPTYEFANTEWMRVRGTGISDRYGFMSRTFSVSYPEYRLLAGDVLYFKQHIQIRTISLAFSGMDDDPIWRNKNHMSIYPTITVAPEYAEGFLGNVNYFTITSKNILTENTLLDPSIILHKVKQSDFVSSIVKMFNLYIEPTSETTFNIEPHDQYYLLNNQTSNVVDWTNQVDTYQPITIERGSDLVDKILDFKYDTDDDSSITKYNKANQYNYGEYYNKGEYNTDDSKYEIKLIFAASANAPIADKFEIPNIFKLDDDDVYQPDDKPEFKPRILYYKGLVNSGTNKYFRVQSINGLYIATYQGWWPYCGHFDSPYDNATSDLMFGTNPGYYSLDANNNIQTASIVTPNNLVNVYYKNMIDEYINPDCKLVTMSINLLPKDIEHVHFYDLIFINGVYYRLNKISNYVAGKLAKVELLTIVGKQLFGWPLPNITPGIDGSIKPITFKPVSLDNCFLDLINPNAPSSAGVDLGFDMIVGGWYDAPFTLEDSKSLMDTAFIINANFVPENKTITIGGIKNN